MRECNSTPWINGILLISTGITFLFSGLTIASQTKKQKKQRKSSIKLQLAPEERPVREDIIENPEKYKCLKLD